MQVVTPVGSVSTTSLYPTTVYPQTITTTSANSLAPAIVPASTVYTYPAQAQMPLMTQQMALLPPSSAVSAFLFTDILGSSKLYAKYGVGMEQAMDTHEKQVNRILRETQTDQDFHGNHLLVKWIGDAVFVEFETLSAAAYFAMRLQAELLNPTSAIYLNPSQRQDRLLCRIGIAYGPAFRRSMVIQNNITVLDFFGNTVNTAARMESKVSAVGGFAIGLTPEVEQAAIAELERFHKLPRVAPLIIWAGRYSPDSDDSTTAPTTIWKWNVERYIAPGTTCVTPSPSLSPTDASYVIGECRDAGELKGVAAVLVVDYIPIVQPL